MGGGGGGGGGGSYPFRFLSILKQLHTSFKFHHNNCYS